MPTRADLDAARPRCRAVVTAPAGGVTACDQPMRFHPGRAIWACPEHGGRLLAVVLLAGQEHGRIV